MKRSYLCLFVAVFFMSFIGSISAQPYGKLYTKTEADNLYGPVKQSIKISTAELKELLSKTKDVIMFNITNGQLTVLGDNRNLIKPGAAFDNNTVFSVYSKSVVQELIDKGQSDITVIEQREKVLTVTNGAATMEFAASCPPLC